VNATVKPFWQAARPRAELARTVASGGQSDMALAGAAVAERDDVLPAQDELAAPSSSTSILLRLGIAVKSKVSKLFTAGNRAARMRRSTTRRSRSINSNSTRRSG